MVVRKMKEKCKDAARMRREKERAEFVELSKLLPLPSSTTSQLDKASIIRLTSSYLRMRAAFPQGLGESWGNDYYHRNRMTNRFPGHHQHHLQQQQQQQQQQNINVISAAQTNSQCSNAQALQDPIHQMQQMHVKELGSLILQTLDGFVFALHRDGKIMYISETASVHLGLPQIDLTGSSVFEYVHPSDHNDIYEILSLSEAEKARLNLISEAQPTTQPSSPNTLELGRSFCMRMKCILPKRNAGLVNSGYKAIHCNGYLKVRLDKPSSAKNVGAANCSETDIAEISGSCVGDSVGNTVSSKDDSRNATVTEQTSSVSGITNSTTAQEEWGSYALVAVGHSLLPTASTEVKLTGNSFMFRANLDLKLYYIETNAIKLLGFEQMNLIGQSLYQLVHLNDVSSLEKSHRSLLEKGQVVTKYYRLMKKTGGSIWVQSYATLVNNPRNMPKPQHIVSICFVLGDNHVDESCILTNLQEQTNTASVVGSKTSSDATSDISRQAPMQQRQQKLQSRKLAPIKKSRKVKLLGGFGHLTQEPKFSQTQQQHLHQPVKPQEDEKISSSNINSGGIPGSGDIGSNSSFVQQVNTQCSCLPPNYTNNLIRNQKHHDTSNVNSIGSIRRPSDDSCSVVSSIASTCVSSNSSSNHNSDFGYVSVSSSINDKNGRGHSGDHLKGYSMNQSSSNMTANIRSSVEHQQHYQLASSITQTQVATSGGVWYDEFGLPQDHLPNNHHVHTAQAHVPNESIISSNEIPLVSQVWPQTTTNSIGAVVVDDLQTYVSMGGDDDRMIGFTQPPNNVGPQYFQSSSNWLAQTNHCSNLVLARERKIGDPHTNGAYLYPNMVDDERHSGYSDTSSMGSSSYYTSHKSPPYMDNTRTAVHYQQVPINNGYTV